MKSDKENLLAAGFNGYLSKPLMDDGLLVATIEIHTATAVKAAA